MNYEKDKEMKFLFVYAFRERAQYIYVCYVVERGEKGEKFSILRVFSCKSIFVLTKKLTKNARQLGRAGETPRTALNVFFSL